MQISIAIEDSAAAAMLAAVGWGPEELAAAETSPEEAVGLLLAAAANVLAGKPDETTTGLAIDTEALRAELLRITSAQRPIEADISPTVRGVPYQVWTPDTNWQSLETSPAQYPELEDHVASLYEILEISPRLRTLISRRRDSANEVIQEGIFADILEDIEFKVHMRGATYRCHVSPVGALVIGSLDGLPQLVRGSR